MDCSKVQDQLRVRWTEDSPVPRAGDAFATGLVEICAPLRGMALQRCRQQTFHLLPALRIHAGAQRLISRSDHILAVAHSRFTVAGEIPSTCDVSSMESPPKKRNSTI
jgi:hypothetical protein